MNRSWSDFFFFFLKTNILSSLGRESRKGSETGKAGRKAAFPVCMLCMLTFLMHSRWQHSYNHPHEKVLVKKAMPSESYWEWKAPYQRSIGKGFGCCIFLTLPILCLCGLGHSGSLFWVFISIVNPAGCIYLVISRIKEEWNSKLQKIQLLW